MPRFTTGLALLLPTLLCAGGLSAQGKGFAYAPGAHHYRVTSTVTRTQEAGGQKAALKIDTDQRVTVTVTRHSADTLDFAVRLDSTSITSEPQVQLPDLSKYIGLNVSGAMSPGGKVFAMKASLDSASDPAVQGLVEGLGRFLVPFPAGTRVGSTWADTNSTAPDSSGQGVTSKTITTSRVLGDTVYAGQRAWRVARTVGTTLDGSTTEGGQQLSVTGKGNGSGMFYVSHAGVYLGSTMKQNTSMTISGAGGMTVPITQTGVSKIELMP
ncbi:MAG TPA: hypothetical protein VFW98_07345 [Gemmatimonadaceae bacterium]|nr:hypothetical protein [Gemmatimonadaceae bacterium]